MRSICFVSVYGFVVNDSKWFKKFISVFDLVGRQNHLSSWIRMFDFQWPENFSIFLDNLCIYHICFDLISFITIIFTWWFCKSSGAIETTDGQVPAAGESDSLNSVEDEDSRPKDDENDNDLLKWSDESIVSNIKIMKQKALVKELQSKLTEDELEEEKRMEKKQLEKIFQLLQDQEEKFHMTSMEQVEDQLHLYRI